MLSTDQFFFEQQRPRRFQHRRLRKIDDTLSNYGGEKRENYLTFTKTANWDNESVLTGIRSLKRPTTATGRRPGTATRRVSVNEVPTFLPSIDPAGPRLVTAVAKEPIIPEAVEVRSILSEKKREFLEEVEGKLQSRERERPSRTWKFTEAKFVSLSVLARLSELIYEDFEVSLPESLVEDLLKSHQDLTVDVIPERREWQTDCYLDFKIRNKQPFLTSLPEEPNAQADLEAAVEKVAKKAIETEKEKVKNKKVRMSRETIQRKQKSPERPQTARSILSNISFKSNVTGESTTDDDGRESRMEYDVLPADLRPGIMHYRQESLVPQMRRSTTKTRLEKFQTQKKEIQTKAKKSRAINLSSGKPVETDQEKKTEETPGASGIHGPTTTINFSMQTPRFYDRGWVVVPSDSRDPEANTLKMWERRLRDFTNKRDEEKLVAKQQGVDGPLVVKFFNDPQIKALRSKHQRSATFPLPAVFNKLPPSLSVTSVPGQSVHEAKLIGEGPTVFVLLLPDGSGYCNYMSGRHAMCVSRRVEGAKGFYTLVYDDVEGSPLLAYFTPTGRACCYYPNGAIRMICDREGGSMFSEDGAVIRKWVWPPYKLNLSQSISIHLNAQVSVRGTNLTNLVLRVSCRGQNYKFAVGPSIENLEQSRLFDTGQGSLLTDVPFMSKSAIRQMKRASSQVDAESIKTAKKGKKRLPSTTSLDEEEEEPSDLLFEGDRLAQVLSSYQERIHNVVSEWMDHYREHIGIRPRSQIGSNVTSRSLTRAASSQGGRRVKSSMSFGYGSGSKSLTSFAQPHGHSRSYTHPLPSRASSRAASPLLPFSLSIPKTAGPPEFPRATSPPIVVRVGSPLDLVQRPTSQSLHPKPFKAGISKPRKRSTHMICGCPVALHNMLWKGLDTLSKCRCDKRRVPYIADLEYDVFLSSHVPREQLVVVCILSTLVENSCPCEPMLDAIHCSLNRMRYSPCTQCSGDSFRLLKYDLSHATHSLSPSAIPLLVQRHNAAPGMFLVGYVDSVHLNQMYMGGKLVHADYMFNGYGTTKKDFMKQVNQCIGDGKQGRSLPHDFKFTQRTGTKVQHGSIWAYPVGGVLQDLIPFTPETHSNAESHSNSTTEVDPEGTMLSMTADSSVFTSGMLGDTVNSVKRSRCSDQAMQSLKGITTIMPVGARES